MRGETAEEPSKQMLENAVAAVTLNLRPVRRLPSDLFLTSIAALFFVALSVAISAALGWKGYASLSGMQRCLYYGTVLGCGLLLCIHLAPQMIPGARRWVNLPVALIVPIALVGICTEFIFPSSGLVRFVPLGIPCLRTALLCAAANGALTYLLLSRGYIARPFQTSLSSTLFAAFTGIAVLALHCPQQNWLHVLVWHLGAPILSTLATWAYWKLRLFTNSA